MKAGTHKAANGKTLKFTVKPASSQFFPAGQGNRTYRTPAGFVPSSAAFFFARACPWRRRLMILARSGSALAKGSTPAAAAIMIRTVLTPQSAARDMVLQPHLQYGQGPQHVAVGGGGCFVGVFQQSFDVFGAEQAALFCFRGPQ